MREDALQLSSVLRSALRRCVRAGLEQSPARARLFWRLPTGVAGAALTFDDGPDAEMTPRILDVLASRRCRATFFVIGENAARFPDLIRRMAAEGHAVGNHTNTHTRCDRLSPAELERELRSSDRAIVSALGEYVVPPRLFRPPFGALGARRLCQVLRGGRRIVLWNRDCRDYLGADAEAVARTGETAQRRDIILLHDRFPATVEALPDLLDSLSRRGIPTVLF